MLKALFVDLLYGWLSAGHKKSEGTEASDQATAEVTPCDSQDNGVNSALKDEQGNFVLILLSFCKRDKRPAKGTTHTKINERVGLHPQVSHLFEGDELQKTLNSLVAEGYLERKGVTQIRYALTKKGLATIK